MSNDDSNGPKRPKKRKIGTLYTCDDCGLTISNKKSLIQHVNNVHLNIHSHLQQILEIKLLHYQGFSVLLSEFFLLGISSIRSVPGKFCLNKRDVQLSMVQI